MVEREWKRGDRQGLEIAEPTDSLSTLSGRYYEANVRPSVPESISIHSHHHFAFHQEIPLPALIYPGLWIAEHLGAFGFSLFRHNDEKTRICEQTASCIVSFACCGASWGSNEQ